ncbi:hypothetical protein [Deinococcus sp.]|uniref:hypothetical protein n=1 Tax=Deinococcus sp. TaxID=47478 RepID=UPI003C7ECBAF
MFLHELEQDAPDLKAEIDPLYGRDGPYNATLFGVLYRHLQWLVDRGDVVPLAAFVALLDRYYRPTDKQVASFDAHIEQWLFDLLPFNCGGGRVSWLVFTPKLRIAYES